MRMVKVVRFFHTLNMLLAAQCHALSLPSRCCVDVCASRFGAGIAEKPPRRSQGERRLAAHAISRHALCSVRHFLIFPLPFDAE